MFSAIKSSYISNIHTYSRKIWIPPKKPKFKDKHSHSWFDIKESISLPKQSNIINIKTKSGDFIKCHSVRIFPDKKQINILRLWFNSYTTMYNKTIRFIQRNINKTKFKLNFYDIRKILSDAKKKMIIKSNKEKSKQIKTHIIDTAIKLAVSNYKSAITNYRNGNIKHFRIRQWKYKKTNLLLEIEPSFIDKNGNICYRALGKLNTLYNGSEYDFKNVKKAIKLKYNADLDEYYIYVPIDEKSNKINGRSNFIAIDPGVRKFATGFASNGIVQICTNAQEKIGSYLDRIDNSEQITNKKKREEKQKLYRRKIRNLIDDMHWKSINYLTKNYDNILIGDMSVRSIISRNRNLNRSTKRILTSLRLFQFKQRLEFKCKIREVGYKEVNESYTSKLCSNCGWENNKLGGSEIFSCKEKKCNLIIDRDINGARGILIKHL